MRTSKRNVFSLVLLIGLVVSLTGCGGGPDEDPFGLIQIDGTLKYSDGSLVQGEKVLLHFNPQTAPLDGKTHPPIGFAEVSTSDGTFGNISSRGFQNGIVPGKHKVTVEVLGGSVPSQYTDTALTPLEIDTANPPFDLTITKE